MKPKHTPGVCSVCTKQIYDHFGTCICNECRDKLPPPFAAAPDLLNEVYNARQVIQAVIDHLETGERWSDSMVDDLKSELLGMSLKINKATGGAE